MLSQNSSRYLYARIEKAAKSLPVYIPGWGIYSSLLPVGYMGQPVTYRSCEGKPTRPQAEEDNLLIRGSLRAYALTLALLGFKCS